MNWVTNMRSVGVSSYAYRLECEESLDSITLRGETLERFVKALCDVFDVAPPTLKFDGRLGTGTRRVRMGYYRGWFGRGEIKLSRSVGMTVKTTVHEIAHHVTNMVNGPLNKHNRVFKDQHEAILEDFLGGHVELDGVVMDPERMRTEAQLDGLFETYPTAYDEIWVEGISAEDMIEKIQEKVRL